MTDNIIKLNEDLIKHDLKNPVRSSAEETLNAQLIRKQPNWSMLANINVLPNVRATAPVTTRETSIPLPGRRNYTFPNSKPYPR